MRETPPQRRAFWLKHLHRWHWISAALSLIGMLLFAATGITLNNAAHIEASPSVVTREGVLPEPLRAELAAAGEAPTLPLSIERWLAAELGVTISGHEAERSSGEVYIALPRPGGDAWLTIDTQSGDVAYELTRRGWISYLNDLHKGRNTGIVWSWFLDVFAGACVVFCLTGLFLLQLHAGNRPATWPVVGAGLAIPLLLALLFIH
ncbi:PepSY-associated TM helix domain-containing protein [Iodidimonas sp. SYSU 1G8]|uniref:PepSY-associated TM helix domain-containing protein n=1 Tax=Iodidimonas sp. SYSU 1G8 TaxID=3133967 RepID=UPI0031FEFF5B